MQSPFTLYFPIIKSDKIGHQFVIKGKIETSLHERVGY